MVVFRPKEVLSTPVTACVLALTVVQFGSFMYLYGPKFLSVDLAATKRFTVAERVRASLQAEFLNAFNHPNFILGGLPNINSTSFGQQTNTANAPRQAQLRLQFDF